VKKSGERARVAGEWRPESEKHAGS
jgi:hypothetical protein